MQRHNLQKKIIVGIETSIYLYIYLNKQRYLSRNIDKSITQSLLNFIIKNQSFRFPFPSFFIFFPSLDRKSQLSIFSK